jgi:hypothetical protein
VQFPIDLTGFKDCTSFALTPTLRCLAGAVEFWNRTSAELGGGFTPLPCVAVDFSGGFSGSGTRCFTGAACCCRAAALYVGVTGFLLLTGKFLAAVLGTAVIAGIVAFVGGLFRS